MNKNRISDSLLAAFLIAITAMLLVPLPTALLDVLLVINLSFSLVLLLAALYLPNALSLLAFPSILLLTALFRLSLNVASTRLILSRGEAGEVIKAFGTFLISGEIVVGIIIFLILTVVNFIVVARGAARVSEVAARFALDALPGKQMAIDADVRAGLISSTDAQRRREELRKESQLYGSMDGAMKFVQGDAVAGLFIIAVNIVGGIYLGVSGGMSVSEAISTYTTLTVGDGLVHQVPAILISICAGMIVTRVSSGEGSSLGSDVQAQLFARPGTIVFAGGLIAAMGLAPGLPFAPFAGVGVVLCAAGWIQMHRMRLNSPSVRASETSIVISDAAPARLLGLDAGAGDDDQVLEVLLSPSVLLKQFRTDQARYRAWWQQLDGDFYQEHGFHLPQFRVGGNSALPFGAYQVRVRGTSVIEGQVLPDAALVEVSPHAAVDFGFEVLSEVEHPIDGSSVSWIVLREQDRRVLELGSIPALDPIQFIGLQAAAFFRDYPEELLSVAEVIEIENRLEKKHPGLLSRTLNREFLTPARLTEILQELIREGEGIRDVKQIVEAIATYCSTEGAGLVAEGEFNLEDVVSFVRRVRRRHIVGRLMSPRRTLRVVTLHDAVTALFEEAPPVEPHGVVAMPPETSESVRRALRDAVLPVRRLGIGPFALLVTPEIRARVVAFVRQAALHVPVVTFEELEPSTTLEPLKCVAI